VPVDPQVKQAHEQTIGSSGGTGRRQMAAQQAPTAEPNSQPCQGSASATAIAKVKELGGKRIPRRFHRAALARRARSAGGLAGGQRVHRGHVGGSRRRTVMARRRAAFTPALGGARASRRTGRCMRAATSAMDLKEKSGSA
jgi:hypothetical protein